MMLLLEISTVGRVWIPNRILDLKGLSEKLDSCNQTVVEKLNDLTSTAKVLCRGEFLGEAETGRGLGDRHGERQ